MADDKLKEIDTQNCTYYYLDDLNDIYDLGYIRLLDENPHEDFSFIILGTKLHIVNMLCILFFAK